MRYLAGLLTLAALAAAPCAAQAQEAAPDDAKKIAGAMSAAPMDVARDATIMDWPAAEGAQPRTLRAGTNGWTCFPDMLATEGNDPACFDATWMKWGQAYMAHQPPAVDRVGVSYMIAPGGGMGSNTDPYATARTADNDWGRDPPHLMILVPDPASLAGYPTKRGGAGPWVMFPGTPYAHLMVPVRPATASQ
jgi:hypothetical protein